MIDKHLFQHLFVVCRLEKEEHADDDEDEDNDENHGDGDDDDDSDEDDDDDDDDENGSHSLTHHPIVILTITLIFALNVFFQLN